VFRRLAELREQLRDTRAEQKVDAAAHANNLAAQQVRSSLSRQWPPHIAAALPHSLFPYTDHSVMLCRRGITEGEYWHCINLRRVKCAVQ